MGKRGPAPQPTQLKLLHGAQPYRINRDEPIPEQGNPECPDDASDEVRAIWDYTIKQLIIMGIATKADRDALRCYCEAVVTHRKACAILAKTPILLPGPVKGTVVRNQAVIVQRDAAAAVAFFARQFGFTPSARSEIRTSAAKETSGPAAAGADRFFTSA
jgi:P27 family predicted phage terminase small subunit